MGLKNGYCNYTINKLCMKFLCARIAKTIFQDQTLNYSSMKIFEQFDLFNLLYFKEKMIFCLQ